MHYISLRFWILGYLSALEKNENISRKHIDGLIEKFKKMIEDIENDLSEKISEENQYEEDDDLPF